MAPSSAPTSVANPFAKASGVNGLSAEAISAADAEAELVIALLHGEEWMALAAADADEAAGVGMDFSFAPS
jgi:hypothetical protein